ncbi:MAG: hypothetical protein O2807_11700 [bacterium]|nr:hypothetical protein [bacterium]
MAALRTGRRFFMDMTSAAWLLAGALALPLPAGMGVRMLYRAALATPPAIVLTLAATAQDAAARGFGGGRSFGFRGSRGLGGFSRRSSFGRRSGNARSYGRGGFGLPFLMGMGLGGFGFGGFGGIFIYPILLLFLLRILRGLF